MLSLLKLVPPSLVGVNPSSRRLVDHKYTFKVQSCSSTTRLARDTCRQALPAPRPPGGCHVPPSAQRLKILLATGIAWQYYPHRQAPATQFPSVARLSPGVPNRAARRCISTATLHLNSYHEFSWFRDSSSQCTSQ